MVAVSCDALTYEVALELPFHCTVDVEMKLDPFTVKVNPAAPAFALGGESEVIDGTGSLMGRLTAAEVPPPGAGLATVTLADPAVAISAAVICAVSCVPLT